MSGWHASGEFNIYSHDGRDANVDEGYARALRQGYAASTSYVDAQAGRVLDALRELKLDENTIVVVWGDHGFLLGEHAIWGKHSLYENALRAPLLVRSPGLTGPGQTSPAIVETVDLFPTLTELCRLPAPAGLDGRSLGPQLRNPAVLSAKPAVALWNRGQRTVRTDRWRLIAHPASPETGGVPAYELFDFALAPGESVNLAEALPRVVAELVRILPSPVE